MGVYYKLVNPKLQERIEPEFLGGGGIKSDAIVGDTARLYTWLHLRGELAWQIVSDNRDLYHDSDAWPDCTAAYATEFNESYPHVAVTLLSAEER